MAFDFTTMYERHGLDALAVDLVDKKPEWQPDEGFDVIPMWVADMNFATAPAVTEAIAGRLEHPLFGYFMTRDEYNNSIISWHRRRFGVDRMTADHITYENGVLGGLMSALRAVCEPGAAVLMHSPCYIGFTGSFKAGGFEPVYSPLVQDAEGVWHMDFADMEERIKSRAIKALIFCSPHNPSGRVWSAEEIIGLVDLCERLDVTIISDEIWADLTCVSVQHIPTQSVSEAARQRTVALYAPSKTFNLAGLVGSYSIVYNDALRTRMQEAAAATHYNSMNVLSMYALMGAYSPQGEAWVDELRQVLTTNLDFACGYIADHFPGVRLAKPEGTYMLFLDCTDYCESAGITLDELLTRGFKCGVLWQDGRPFLGECAIRMNVALPTARLQEAFRRLSEYVFL